MSTITATQNIDIRNDSFLSILSILTEDTRIFLLVFFINPICSHSYNFEYTPYHKGHSSSTTPALGRLAVFNRKGGVTGASSLADHSAFIYKRHSCRLLTWFVVFPEAFLAFAAQVSGAVQEAVDLMAVLANEYAALFFSGGSADGTLLFCSVGA